MAERIGGSLVSTTGLSLEGGDADRNHLKSLVQLLARPTGILGGGEMSRAILLRAQTVMPLPGQTPDIAGIVVPLLGIMPTRASEVSFVLDAMETDRIDSRRQELALMVLDVLNELTTVSGLWPDAPDPAQTTTLISRITERVTAVEMPDETRDKILERIEALCTGRMSTLQPARSAPAGKKKSPLSEKQTEVPDDFATSTSRRKIAADTVIFQTGDYADEAYLIHSGVVQIFRSAGGHDLPVATLGRGTIFGEMALIDDKPRSASAKTLETCEFVVLPRHMFKTRLQRLSQEDPMMRRLVEIFVQRLRNQISAPIIPPSITVLDED